MKFKPEGHLFTLIFTFVSTIVLVFPLTIAFQTTKPIADQYWLNQHYSKTLSALGVPFDRTNRSEIEQKYKSLKKFKLQESGGKVVALQPATDEEISNELQAATMGNMKTFLYVTEVDGKKRYAGNFFGPGLWGNVSIAVGTNEDATVIQGMQVLYQVETPGLGGRIGESWFTDQFKNLNPLPEIVFNQGGQKQSNGIDSITGATITSTAVKDIVNQRAIAVIKSAIELLKGTL